jgi:hypothetical protein
MRLESVDDLRTIYRPPRGGAVDKVIDHLDAHCADFLARSPFFVLSTADASGVCDASPKGGQPGFVRALDERRLAWADLAGNNRLDSFENLVDNPHVGLLFLIPGLDETLRVNGTAELRTDADLLEAFAVDGKPARVVVVVTVAEAYIHCAKALRRGGLWDTASWSPRDELPSIGCIVRDHASVNVAPEVIDAALEDNLQKTLWEPGGQ